MGEEFFAGWDLRKKMSPSGRRQRMREERAGRVHGETEVADGDFAIVADADG